MKKLFTSILLFFLIHHGLQAQIVLSLVTSSLSAPVDIRHAGDKRLFIVERSGTIRLIDSSGVLQPLPFLNIVSRVKSGGEEGLLGLAFDPNYKTNGFFYTYYTSLQGAIVLSRFYLTGDPNHCDSTTEQKLLTIYHPFGNHNGGSLAFGADGYLYMGTGDGGSGGDPGNRAQNIDSLLGKVLRLDVSDSSVGYSIPPGNPFVGTAGRDEIWAYGLRNPWRFSFDRLTNDLWIADVGQNLHEEINVMPGDSAGVNYGWRCYEGNVPYNSSGCGASSNYTFPVYVYDHDGSQCSGSITGGYRYRGSQFPSFAGRYFYADYCFHVLNYLTETSPGVYTNTLTTASLPDVSTFGEDVNGELYVGTIGGHAVYKICDASCVTGTEEATSNLNMGISPNPNEGAFTLSFSSAASQPLTVSVSNMLGQKVFNLAGEFSKGEHRIPVDLSYNAGGVYLLSIKSGMGVSVKRVVVKQ